MMAPNLMVRSSLDQITFTDKRRAMPSLPLSGPVFPFECFSFRPDVMYYYNYRFTVYQVRSRDGPFIVFSVNRYRADDESALPSLFINPEAPTTRTNIIRRHAQRTAGYHLTVVRGDAKGPRYLYLLLGDTARSNLRLLFVFSDNRPPELKFLDFSWHDMIMDIEDFYANRDANSINDVDKDSSRDLIPRQYNRKSEELSVPLRSKDSHPQ